jgi:ribosomal-protein-alanine N-acetyltransferase
MAFLRHSNPLESGATIFGGEVTLRTPQLMDYQAWAELRAESRAFLTPWEPTWRRDELTRAAYRRRLKHYARDMREDQAYPFFIFSTAGETLLGGVTISNIRRGVAQSGAIGYWMGRSHARRGNMTAALTALIPFAFDTVGLHRIEAACLPHNAASIGLLLKCGFEREGYARRYLRINGAWQDHVLFALLSEEARR